jgi:hypothetical protein
LQDRSTALQHLQPRGRGVQFGLGAILPNSNTPSLRATGFEDEDEDDDEDEDEYEAPCEGGPVFKRYLGLKPQAESYCPFGAETEFFMELLKVNTYGLKPCAMVSSRFAAESDRYLSPPLNLETFCDSAEFAVKFQCRQSSSNEN